MLHSDDCFLRLPCREDLYEAQNIPETPYFSTVERSLPRNGSASLGNMAYLIAVSSAWSDVLQNLYRTKHRVIDREDGAYERFYDEKQRQLQAFIDRLPSHLFPSNTQNIQQSLQGGYAGTFICLHALYHTTLMKLNRHAAYGELREGGLSRNLRAAQFYARELLKVTHTLSELHRERHSPELAWIFSTPFQGYSVLSAVDILTSMGSLADMKSDIRLVQSSLEVVQELSRYWASAQKQLQMIVVRLGELMKALDTASVEDTVFVTTQPMEDIFGKKLDLLLSPGVEEKLTALGLGAMMKEGNGVLTI
jgi:hypothetical protein